MNKQSLAIGFLCLLVAIFLGFVFFLYSNKPEISVGYYSEIVGPDFVVGDFDSEGALTDDFADNRLSFLSANMTNLTLNITFTPENNDSLLEILIEKSDDGGETFIPIGTQSYNADFIALNTEGVNGVIAVFPGDLDSTADEQEKGMYQLTIPAKDYIRVSARATNGGDALIYTTLHNSF